MGSTRSMVRQHARRLRRDQTDAEQKLWGRLRDRQLCGAKFRRQHPIGVFIVDFCCPQRKLVVELDGGQHAEPLAADQERSRFLEGQGYRVLRFWNHDVLTHTDAVLERIAEALGSLRHHQNPLQETLTSVLSQRERK